MWAAATRYQRKERLDADAKDSAAILSKSKFGPLSNRDGFSLALNRQHFSVETFFT